MRVIATAGHVDHGKSTLVRALTGMEPDRWAEEHRRGLTIDLGFVWTTLPSGEALEFVDVPGHQRFITNMLAGLGPAPAVLFVVAADAGWSRQSTEHLAAIDALGVGHGVLAVTRSDLADPGPALREARERLAASSLGDVTAVVVSGRTGEGLDELRTALDGLAAAMPAPDPAEAVRLWIDRAFAIRGSGTVVTGTLGAGTVNVGDAFELDGRRVVVRGLQSMGAPRDGVPATARVALNLRGIAHTDVRRGDVLTSADAWHRTEAVDVRVGVGVDALAAELVMHVGSAAVPVRVRPLGPDTARLTWAGPLPLRAGDRAVLRDPGRQTIAAGVLVLDADPPALSRRGAAARRAATLAPMTGRPTAAVEVERRGAVRVDQLRRLGITPDDAGRAHAVGEWLVAAARWEDWLAGVPNAVESWARERPLDPAMPAAALRRALALPADELVDAVVRAAGFELRGGRVLVDRPSDLGPAETGVRRIEEQLRTDPFDAPDSGALAALGVGSRELAAAERAGRLLRVGPGIVLLPSAPQSAVALLTRLDQPFTLSHARQALATSRRVAVPLLEYLDAQGLTERLDGTQRRVRRSEEALSTQSRCADPG